MACLVMLFPALSWGQNACFDIPNLTALQRVVDAHVCADEYDLALEFSLFGERFDGQKSILASWDGSPFVVNVSSLFTNADELLGMVDAEAGRINGLLGYRVFVPGNVMPLPRIRSREHYHQVFSTVLPPPQQVHILCCDESLVYAGFGAHVDRLIVLSIDHGLSEGAILHELYHLLGFSHPGEPTGVHMSHTLMYDDMSIPTAADLAALACIFDEASDQASVEEPPGIQDVAATDEVDWDAWLAGYAADLADFEQAMRELAGISSGRADLGEWNWLYDIPGGGGEDNVDLLAELVEDCRVAEAAGWPNTYYYYVPPDWCDDLGDLYP